MGREQRREPPRIAACHATFGSDAVHISVPPRRGKPGHVAGSVIVVDEAEIELGRLAKMQLSERRKIGVISAFLGHGHVEKVDRPPHRGHDGIGDLHHDAGILRLHQVLVGRTTITQVIAKLDAGRHRISDLRLINSLGNFLCSILLINP